jgi:hypothetical protein
MIAGGVFALQPVEAREVNISSRRDVLSKFEWSREGVDSHIAKARAAYGQRDKVAYCYEMSETKHYFLQMQEIDGLVRDAWRNTENAELAVKIAENTEVYRKTLSGLNKLGSCSS